VRTGLIADDQLLEARRALSTDGGTLGEFLVLNQIVEDDTLTSFYHHRLMVPLVGPNSLARIPKRIISVIPADMAAEFRLIPVHADGQNNLTVAMSDPSDTHAVDEITFFTGKYVIRAVATQRQLAWCLAHYYGFITHLGETLLKPTEKPEVSPANGVPKPIRERPKNLTAKVNAARHKAIAPQAEDSDDEAPILKKLRQRKERSVTPATSPMLRIPSALIEVDPPELRPRAGELTTTDDDDLRKTDSLPAVILDKAEEWADDAVIILDQKMKRPTSSPPVAESQSAEADEDDYEEYEEEDDESDTEDDHTQVDNDPLQDAVPEATKDEPSSEVVLLQRKKPITRRRKEKRTRLGIGLFDLKPTPSASDVRALQPPVLPGTRPTAPVGKAATSIPVTPPSKPQAPSKVEPQRIPLRTLGEAFQHATEQSSGEVHAIQDEDAKTEKSAVPKHVDQELPDSETGQFDRIPASMADVDDGWGPPGTTIPPPFLGALPDSDIDDDLGDGAIPLRTRDETGGTLKLVRPSTRPFGVPVNGDSDDTATPSERPPRAEAAEPSQPAQHKGPGDDAVVRQREFEDSSAQLVETLRDIDRGESRDAIIESLLGHMEIAYDNVNFFTVKSGKLRAWAPKNSPRETSPATLPLDKSSTFQDVVRTRLPYSGDLTDDTSASYLRGILGRNPGRVLILPLSVRERVVGVLCGTGSKRRAFEEHLSVTARAAGLALERLLKKRSRSQS